MNNFQVSLKPNNCWECLIPEIAEELTNLNHHEHSHVHLQYSLRSSHFFVSLTWRRYEVNMLIRFFPQGTELFFDFDGYNAHSYLNLLLVQY